MTINYYDRNNRLLSMDQFAKLMEDREYKRVCSDYVGSYWVSTVWLGLDHSFYGGPPLIFESMVFADTEEDSNRLGEDVNCQRYPTEHQAVLGHYAIVEEVNQAVQRGIPYNGYTDYADT
jgi:hypothetical protein